MKTIWIALVVAFVSLLFGFWVEHAPNVSGDTTAIISGSETVIKCVEKGELVGCNAAFPKQPVTQFPLYQYLPSIGMTLVGMSVEQQLTAFSLISVASFLLLIMLVGLLLLRSGKNQVGGLSLILILLASPLLWYAYSTFGEMFAAFLIMLFTAAVYRRWHWLAVAATLCLAGLTKETAAPFLVVIGLICLFISPLQKELSKRRSLIGMAVGAAAAIGLSMAFNIFRYGHIQNDIYTNVKGPPLGQKLSDFLALFASPNGGIISFWPLASAALIFGLVCAVTALRRKGQTPWWPGLVVFSTFLVLCIGLAIWPFPFGWVAWGSRFVIPWVPALIFILVVTYHSQLRTVVAWLTRSTSRLVLTTLVVSALALPQVGVLWKPQVVGGFFSPDKGCPYVATYDMGAKYYKCLNYLAWQKQPILVKAYGGFNKPASITMGILLILASYSLLNLMRTSVTPALSSRPDIR